MNERKKERNEEKETNKETKIKRKLITNKGERKKVLEFKFRKVKERKKRMKERNTQKRN